MKTSLSLTERRKAETQLDIARTAARLFAEHGVARVTVEQIAAAAGVSVRTFYRYFSSKQDAVAPLFTVGAAKWRAAIERHDDGDLPSAIAAAVAEVLVPDDERSRAELDEVRELLRAAQEDSALNTVWHRVNGEAERQLITVLAEHDAESAPSFSVRLLASAATDAIRVSLEHWSVGGHNAERPDSLASRAFVQLSRGIEGL